MNYDKLPFEKDRMKISFVTEIVEEIRQTKLGLAKVWLNLLYNISDKAWPIKLLQTFF